MERMSWGARGKFRADASKWNTTLVAPAAHRDGPREHGGVPRDAAADAPARLGWVCVLLDTRPIPRTRANPARVGWPSSARGHNARMKHRILIIEDHAPMRRNVALLLDLERYEVAAVRALEVLSAKGNSSGT
jgi:hypothetical protein